MALQVGELYSTLELDTGRFDSTFRRVQSNTNRDLPNATDTAGKGFSRLGKIADGAMMAIGAGIMKVVGKVVEVGASAITTGIQFNAMKEQSLIAWSTLLGTMEDAESMIQRIQTLGAKTPFEFEDLDKASKKLHMAKFEGDELERALVAVGDAVSAVGAGSEGLDGVTSALYKMSAKGKASAEEMNMLAERGIPAWDILAETMGKSVPELMKMSEQGKLLAKDVIPALVDGMENKFGGAMEKQSASFNGLMSTMADNWKILTGNIMNGVFEYLSSVLPTVIGWLDKMNEAFANGSVERYIEMFKSAMDQMWQIVSPVVQPIIDLIVELGNKFKETFQGMASDGSLQAIADSMIGAFEGVVAYLTPIIQTICDLISGIYDIYLGMVEELVADGTIQAFFDNIKGLFETLGQIIGPILEQIKNLILNTFQRAKELVMPLIEDFVAFIGEATQMMQQFWADHGEQIMTIVEVAFGAIQFVIDIVMGFIVSIITNCWENIKGMFSGALDFIGGLLDFFSNLFTGNWSALWGNIQEMVKGAFEFVWNLINFILNINVIKSITNFAKGAINIVKGWVGNIKNFFTGLGTSVSTTISNMVSSVINFFKNMWTNTGSIAGSIKSTVVNIFNSIKTSMSNIIKSIVNFFSTGWNNMLSMAGNITGAIGNIVTAIKEKIMGCARDALSWGKDIVLGIARGIKNSVGEAISAVSNLASSIMGKFKGMLGINSPSKVFDQYGQWTSEGLSIGVDRNLDMIKDSADSMAMAIQPDFSNITPPMPNIPTSQVTPRLMGAGTQSGVTPLGGNSQNVNLNIANFNNNRNIDIEVLATELAYYLESRNIAWGNK